MPTQVTLKIRPIESVELPLLKDFAPPEWNTDLSLTFSRHFGYPYYYPIIAEMDGKIVGCAQGLLNGNAGWLGNIVVLPEHRGQGIGHALTAHLVDFFHGRGCRNQILTATKLGEPIYLKLGFATVSHYVFLKRAEPVPSEQVHGIRKAETRDVPSLLALDREVSGEERSPFLRRFLQTGWVYGADHVAGIEGFYLPDTRNGLIIAGNEHAGLELLKFRLARGETSLVVPQANLSALNFLSQAGFEESATAPRMVLGKDVVWKPGCIFSRGAGYSG